VSLVTVSVTQTVLNLSELLADNVNLPESLDPAPSSIMNIMATNAPMIKSFADTIFITIPPEFILSTKKRKASAPLLNIIIVANY
jgi:hypothetical protein